MTQVVGILGGMGPAAGADFVRLFVDACARQLAARGEAVRDQAFPEHWLAQVPVPDRSDALRSAEDDGRFDARQPLEPMLQALGRLAALGSRAVAIACNTAHAWHGTLQARFPQVDVLHVAREVAVSLSARSSSGAVLLATEGTYRTGLYERAFAAAGIEIHRPTEAERQRLMQGIYQGVKAGDLGMARACFTDVTLAAAHRHPGAAIVMGCTELPIGLRGVAAVAGLPLVDPAAVLADALAARAYGA